MITIHNNEEPLYKLAKEIHDNAVSHGWWDEPRNLESHVTEYGYTYFKYVKTPEKRRC